MHTSTSGPASSIWRSVNGRQIADSCGVGVRLPGRPPGHDVGDIDRRAIEPDRRQHAVEQLAGAADERQALDVLVASWRLAHEHHARLRVAVGEHELGGGGAHAQPSKRSRIAAQFFEAGGASSPPRAPP
jgi:hypothetical protein